LTAGDTIMIVTGTGKTVRDARQSCYKAAWQITVPSTADRGFRTDIGERLRKELPPLQEHGFAVGMEY
jgi:phosphoribosylamine-glycine ligase